MDGSFALFFGDYAQSSSAELFLDDGGVDFLMSSELNGLIQGDGSVSNINGSIDAEIVPGGDQIGMITFAGGLIMTPDTPAEFPAWPRSSLGSISKLWAAPLQLNGVLNIQALPGAAAGEYTLFSFNNASNLQFEEIQPGRCAQWLQRLS